LESKPKFALSEEVKDDEKKNGRFSSLVSGLPQGLFDYSLKNGLMVRVKLYLGAVATYNSTAAKYKVLLAGAAPLNIATIVSTGSEFASFNNLFDECFVHKVTAVFEPRNKYGGGYVSVTSTNLETGLGVIYGNQHSANDYTDGSSTWVNAAASREAKVVNSAEKFEFTWTNIEKFDPKGPGSDQSSNINAQGWMECGRVSTNYGGAIGMAMAAVTAAVSAPGAFLNGTTFADVLFVSECSFRARA
jgi:hypothetical protein